MRYSRRRVGIARAVGPDIGNTVALRVGGVRSGAPGEIGSHAVGRRQSGSLADQDNDAVGTECAGNPVANGDATEPDQHDWRDAPAFVRKRRHEGTEHGARMRLHRACGEAFRNTPIENNILVEYF